MANHTIVRAESESTTDATKEISVQCPAGMKVFGGGVESNGPSSDDWITAVRASNPVGDDAWHVRVDAWYARVSRTEDCNCEDGWSVIAWAICAEVTETP
ncbi:MAG: hypothetical protein R2911_02120 [Caldilineaceae bacterium]